MGQMMDLAREFGFHIRAFHHAVEAYKVADLLAANGVAAAMWADWGGFKEEAMDGVQQNLALVQQAGARATIPPHDPGGIQRLKPEVAQPRYAGIRARIPITRD